MTPQWFAEDLLRVYTKKPQFFGLVQAGYRAVLATMPNEFDLTRPETLVTPSTVDPSMAPTPPATEAPCTPKADGHSRNSSFSFLTSSSTATPFSNNSFTTVPSSFAPTSPSQKSKKRRSATGKRLRDDLNTSLSQDGGENTPRKRQKH